MNLILIGGWFYEIWNSIWLGVCNAIYYFIGILYQVFEKVASVNLFSEKVFEKLTGRMYLVIGIAMLFILAYNIILAIISPDGKDKGTSQMTKVVKETIISLVLVVLLPTIFNYLYVFQTHVLESDIIGTIILGGTGTNNSTNCDPTDYDCTCSFPSGVFDSYNNTTTLPLLGSWDGTHNIHPYLEATCKYYRGLPQTVKGAYMVAPSVFSAFYRPSAFDFEECSDHIMGYSTSSTIKGNTEYEKICVNYFADVLISKYSGNIKIFVDDSYLKALVSDENNSSMELHWFTAIVAGILALYMFFCYAMEIGVRVAKLGFLQLISPIPVMMRIIPGQKEKIYKKWFDNLKNTYLDVFIRLAIIYFSLFGISLVPDVLSTMWGSIWSGENYTGLANLVKPVVSVFVILGLLKFAQEAPQLFKEFFGGSGKYALKSPFRQIKENKLAMGAAGAIGAGATGLVKNWNAGKDKTGNFKRGLSSVAGAGSGLVRGAKAGYGSKSFGELKRNVSGAVDRVVQARDDRDMRRKYKMIHTKKDGNGNEYQTVSKGTFGYYADKFGNAFNDWIGGQSFDSLKSKRDLTDKAFGQHKKIMDDTKSTIEGNLGKYSFTYSEFERDKDGNIVKDSTGTPKTMPPITVSLEQLALERDRARSEYTNFNRSAFIDELVAKQGKTRDEAEKAADERISRMSSVFNLANQKYETAISSLTEAVIDHTTTSANGSSKGNWTSNNVEIVDSSGQKTVYSNVSISSDKEVANLRHLIDTANNNLVTHAHEFGEQLSRELSGKTVKQKRDILGDATGSLDAEIAKRIQQKNDSKK